MYGSQTWDLFSSDSEKVYTAWNVIVRQVLRLDRRTHRHLIEPLSDCLHMKVMLMSRMTKFYQSLCSSRKRSVRFLVRLNENDNRTVLGRTLSQLKEDCGLQNNEEHLLNPSIVDRRYTYLPTNDIDI